MLQLLSYLMAGGSSQQTSKLRASANARGQNRKSRFSVTNGRGADSEGIHGFRGASWRGLVHHFVLCENTTIMTTISLALDRNFVRWVDTWTSTAYYLHQPCMKTKNSESGSRAWSTRNPAFLHASLTRTTFTACHRVLYWYAWTLTWSSAEKNCEMA